MNRSSKKFLKNYMSYRNVIVWVPIGFGSHSVAASSSVFPPMVKSEQIWVKSRWKAEELDKQRIEFTLLMKNGSSVVAHLLPRSKPRIAA